MAARADEAWRAMSSPREQANAKKIGGYQLTPAEEALLTSKDGWEFPVPLHDGRVLPGFPVDAFPPWLEVFVTSVAEATQTPTDLPGVLVLSALAAAAGGRAVVEARAGWKEPTNIYTAVALGPGNRKSAVFEIVTRPLHVAERAAIAAVEESITAAEVDRMVADARAKDAARAASRANEDGDGDAAELLRVAKDAAAIAEAVTIPTRPRLLVDDSTPEALTSILAAQGGRAAVMSAEGGVFDIIAGRYSRGFPPLDVYLKGHAGDNLRVDRVGRAPEFIEHPALTLGLAIQPAVLRSIFNREGFRGRGLIARFLFSLPESFVGSRRIGAASVPEDVQERYESDMQALVLSLAEWTDPCVLVFSPHAELALRDYEKHLEPRLGRGGDLNHLADWGSKLAGAIIRIAGLLHLAAHLKTGYREPIGVATFDDAAKLGDYFLDHAIAAHAFMGADPVIEDARDVLRWLHGRKTFTRRDVHRALASRFPKAADLDGPLELLEDRGWIRRLPTRPTGPEGGRPASPTFEVHPNA